MWHRALRAGPDWSRCCIAWTWSTASRRRCRASWILTSRPAFIKAYDDLLNSIGDDEAVLFGDAVHPTHAVRPVGCWGPKETPIAVAQTSGRQRLNIHGAIHLETGRTRMLEVDTVDAVSTIRLMIALMMMYPAQTGDPSFPGQRQIPSRKAGHRPGWRGRVAGSNSTSFRTYCSTPRPDRATMGFDAQAHHP